MYGFASRWDASSGIGAMMDLSSHCRVKWLIRSLVQSWRRCVAHRFTHLTQRRLTHALFQNMETITPDAQFGSQEGGSGIAHHFMSNIP